MKTYKSIADDMLRKKVDAENRADAERAENVQVDEKIKAIVEKKLAEIQAGKKAVEEEEAFKVRTTKPMSGLKVHTVEPVIESVVEKPVVQEKPVVKEKPVVQNNPVIKKKSVVEKRWYDRIRPFGFEDSE